MSQDDVVARITKNPKFQQFVSTRNVYSNIMTMLMMIVYFGYILLIAFEERAAILEFDAGMNRSEAERLAAQMVCEDAEAEFMMGSREDLKR